MATIKVPKMTDAQFSTFVKMLDVPRFRHLVIDVIGKDAVLKSLAVNAAKQEEIFRIVANRCDGEVRPFHKCSDCESLKWLFKIIAE